MKRHQWEKFSKYRAACKRCGVVREGNGAPIYKQDGQPMRANAGACLEKPQTKSGQ